MLRKERSAQIVVIFVVKNRVRVSARGVDPWKKGTIDRQSRATPRRSQEPRLVAQTKGCLRHYKTILLLWRDQIEPASFHWEHGLGQVLSFDVFWGMCYLLMLSCGVFT